MVPKCVCIRPSTHSCIVETGHHFAYTFSIHDFSHEAYSHDLSFFYVLLFMLILFIFFDISWHIILPNLTLLWYAPQVNKLTLLHRRGEYLTKILLTCRTDCLTWIRLRNVFILIFLDGFLLVSIIIFKLRLVRVFGWHK